MSKPNPMTEPPPPYQIGGGAPGTQPPPQPGFMPNQPTATVFPAQPGIKLFY